MTWWTPSSRRFEPGPARTSDALRLLALAGLGYAGLVALAGRAFLLDRPLREVERELDLELAKVGVRARHHYLETGSGRIHVLEAGGGSRAVLMVSGLGASAGEFSDLISLLQEDRRILALDRPGVGLSDPARGRGHPRQEWVELIREVADHFALDRFELLGHSLGGLAAGCFATRHSDRVERLILISPLGLEPKVPWSWNLVLLPGVARILAASSRAGLWLQRTLGFPLSPYREAVLRRFGSGADLARIPRFLGLGSLPPESLLLPGLGLLSGRSVVIWGSNDRQLALAGAQDALRLFPGVQLLVVEGTGHLLPFERPELVAQLLLAPSSAP